MFDTKESFDELTKRKREIESAKVVDAIKTLAGVITIGVGTHLLLDSAMDLGYDCKAVEIAKVFIENAGYKR